jgi:NADP-reducing hydrogenase subunit HndA
MLPSEHYRQPEAGAVLTALHDITARCGYLPEDEVRRAATELGVPLAQMFSTATFYAAFSFKPCGRHKIQVCEGTACYVKGAAHIQHAVEECCKVKFGQTTPDNKVSLVSARCVGSCGLAPVAVLDGEVIDCGSFDRIASLALAVVDGVACAVEGDVVGGYGAAVA